MQLPQGREIDIALRIDRIALQLLTLRSLLRSRRGHLLPDAVEVERHGQFGTRRGDHDREQVARFDDVRIGIDIGHLARCGILQVGDILCRAAGDQQQGRSNQYQGTLYNHEHRFTDFRLQI